MPGGQGGGKGKAWNQKSWKYFGSYPCHSKAFSRGMKFQSLFPPGMKSHTWENSVAIGFLNAPERFVWIGIKKRIQVSNFIPEIPFPREHGAAHPDAEHGKSQGSAGRNGPSWKSCLGKRDWTLGAGKMGFGAGLGDGFMGFDPSWEFPAP